MAYEAASQGWWRKALGLLGGLLAFFAAKALVTTGMREYRNHTTDWPAEIDSKLTSDPSMGRLFSAFKESFPADYDDFRNQLSTQLKNGRDKQEIKQYSFDYMRSFTKRQISNLVQAPHQNLEEFRANQLAAVDTLAGDSEQLCATYVMSGLRPTDEPSQEAAAAIGEAAASQMRAAAAGRASPAHRATGSLTEQESFAFGKALQASGMSQTELAILADERQLRQAAAETQCEIGRKMLRAVAAMRRDTADRITTYLVSEQPD